MDAKQGLAAILRDARKGALLRMRSVSFTGSFARNDGNSRHNFTIPPRDAPEPLMNLPARGHVAVAENHVMPRMFCGVITHAADELKPVGVAAIVAIHDLHLAEVDAFTAGVNI